jgi:hypothetical protein
MFRQKKLNDSSKKTIYGPEFFQERTQTHKYSPATSILSKTPISQKKLSRQSGSSPVDEFSKTEAQKKGGTSRTNRLSLSASDLANELFKSNRLKMYETRLKNIKTDKKEILPSLMEHIREETESLKNQAARDRNSVLTNQKTYANLKNLASIAEHLNKDDRISKKEKEEIGKVIKEYKQIIKKAENSFVHAELDNMLIKNSDFIQSYHTGKLDISDKEQCESYLLDYIETIKEAHGKQNELSKNTYQGSIVNKSIKTLSDQTKLSLETFNEAYMEYISFYNYDGKVNPMITKSCDEFLHEFSRAILTRDII